MFAGPSPGEDKRVVPQDAEQQDVILIIDDDPQLRKTLADILGARGYEALSAKDGAEGLALLRQRSVNVVLIDLGLPDMPGIEVLNRAKAASPSLEAIILTGQATLDAAIEATNKGAFSFLQKPYDMDQLLLQIRHAAEKQEAERKILRQNAELNRINSELRILYAQANLFSLQDHLTGLPNRRALETQLEKCFEAAKRYGESLTVVMLDIDHFKRFNDTHGHPAGDRLLQKLAQVIPETLRTVDQVFRYGGEEFLAILPSTDLTGGSKAAERLRGAVESDAGVTVSLGVATFRQTMRHKEELIDLADKALYRAKKQGRNRVEVCDG